MEGLSERQYAARAGLSRGAIQKAKAAGRLVLHADGSIDAEASDARRAEATDPSKTRKAPQPKRKPVPEAAVSAVGDTLKEQGLAAPATGGGTTFLQAKTANEVLKAQERRIRLQKLKGEMIDRARALALVFRLARQERDVWVNWPAPGGRADGGGSGRGAGGDAEGSGDACPIPSRRPRRDPARSPLRATARRTSTGRRTSCAPGAAGCGPTRI